DANGVAPPTEVVHLHHGVFLNLSNTDMTSGGAQRFAGTGEEKTVLESQYPYGYFVRGSDVWALNYMLHNETPDEQTVWITYDVDYVPANTPLGRKIKPVTPVWMDVQNGSAYPVFDVHRGSGTNGEYTHPEPANPYPYKGKPLNQWTVPQDGTVVATAGHVHPGGLYTDVDVTRPGAKPAVPRRSCRRVRSRSHRRGHRARARVRCRAAPPGPIPGHEPGSVRLFRSHAHYFDPAGPVSWDLAMERTPNDWHPLLRKGDRLSESATYETRLGSWYESMGINILYVAFGDRSGTDPFTHTLDQNGFDTHGHLRENNNYGGLPVAGAVDPTKQANGATIANGVAITGLQDL